MRNLRCSLVMQASFISDKALEKKKNGKEKGLASTFYNWPLLLSLYKKQKKASFPWFAHQRNGIVSSIHFPFSCNLPENVTYL